jgi:predicted secreted protein
MKTLPLLFVLSLLLPVAALAGQDTLFDTVALTAEAETEVDNDRIEALLFAEQEGPDPAKLADAVNREMDWALRQLKDAAGIDASTPAYQTFPVYQQGRITGWRVRQTLKLESADVPAMSAVLGKLQARLGLQGVSFVLSPAQRQAVEEDLIKQALARFTARAGMVAKELGRGGYRLVSMQVNSGGQSPRPQLAMMRAESLAVAAPRLEGGSSTVQVTVSGTIQLKD